MSGVKLLTENEMGFDGTCFCASGKRRVDKFSEKHFQLNSGVPLHFDELVDSKSCGLFVSALAGKATQNGARTFSQANCRNG
jgi:hypothetical protein